MTAVTEAEVRTGIAFLPEGRRRRSIAEAADRAFGGLFAGRVLPFDSRPARVYAEIAGGRHDANTIETGGDPSRGAGRGGVRWAGDRDGPKPGGREGGMMRTRTSRAALVAVVLVVVAWRGPATATAPDPAAGRAA